MILGRGSNEIVMILARKVMKSAWHINEIVMILAKMQWDSNDID